MVASSSLLTSSHPWKGRCQDHVTHFRIFLFCSLAVLDLRVGHTMDVLSPFICVFCHSDWLFHGESCPRLDVVHPGRAWNREKKRCVLRGWFRVWNDATRSVRRSCRIWRASWAVRREVCLRSWPTAAGTHLCCHSCVSLHCVSKKTRHETLAHNFPKW